MDKNSSILPLVFGIVCKKPQCSTNYVELCGELDGVLNGQNGKEVHNLKEEVDKALAEGKSIGVISIKGESIHIPFEFTTANVPLMPNEEIKAASKLNGRKPSAKGSDAKGKTKVAKPKKALKSLRPKHGGPARKREEGKPKMRQECPRKNKARPPVENADQEEITPPKRRQQPFRKAKEGKYYKY